MKSLPILVAVWCLGGAALSAEEKTPPAPAGFILDQTNLFTPERAGQISRALTELHRSSGAAFYVVTFSFLGTDSTREQVMPLVGEWLGKEPGVVLAYNRGNGTPAIVPSAALWKKYPTDDVARMMNDSMGHVSTVVIPPEERMASAISLVIDRLQKMEAERAARHQRLTSSDAKIAAGVALALALPGGLWWFLSARRRKRDGGHGGPWSFPEVQVGTRLGAQYGGGAVGTGDQAQR